MSAVTRLIVECVFRRICQFDKRRRRLRVSGAMGFGGSEVQPPDHRDAILGQHL